MRKVVPVMFMFLVITVFHITKINALKFYPVLMNFIGFSTCLISLFCKETVIERIARLAKQRDLLPEEIEYTRKVTRVWALFLFCNCMMTLATVYMNPWIWTIYNGCISYILTGIVFAVEYLVRNQYKKRYNIFN